MLGMFNSRRQILFVLTYAFILFSVVSSLQTSAAGYRIVTTDNLTIGVWYPSIETETLGSFGPYDVQLAFDAPVIQGFKFPIILLSHGLLGPHT